MLYIVRNLRSRPTNLTTYWVNIRGLFKLTLKDRVNELMTNNIRLTYIYHTFLEYKSIKPYLGLISVDILTLHPNIGIIWCYFDPTETDFQYQETYMYAWHYCHQLSLSWSHSLVSLKVKVSSSEPLVIKLIVEIKVVPNLNRA